ncbi:MAG: MBL fold metallo-hydrolase [Actinomycetota bacterium]|nr:MBL fold metallo-hydrolase [Actinomycetota bacterium]
MNGKRDPEDDNVRPASTVVLLRDSARGLEVLVTVRPKHLRFMGGATVFPGGAVAPEDADPRWVDAAMTAPSDAASLLDEDDPHEALGWLVCALRESYEEVGFIVGEGPLHELPRDVTAGEFRDAAIALGVRLGTDELVPAGRWVTPNGSPVRFDARFFVARVDTDWSPAPDPSEVASCSWVTATEALAEFAAGNSIMAPPTTAMLQKLEAFSDVDSALEGLRAATLRWDEKIYRVRLSPLVQLVLAPNPGLLTGPGTNTYIVGADPSLVIDPAVDDPEYLHEVLDAAAEVAAILVTHRHPDHVGGIRALAAQWDVEVEVRAWGDGRAGGCEVRPLLDGEVLEFGGGVLETVFAPGHAADHVCFWLAQENALFAGDNVLGEGTSVIAPPDGDMKAYLDTLRRLEVLGPRRIYPGHFRPLDDGVAVLRHYQQHRKEREVKILAALADGPATLEEVVTRAYDDTPVELHPAAQMSALAHLDALESEGRVGRAGEHWERAEDA